MTHMTMQVSSSKLYIHPTSVLNLLVHTASATLAGPLPTQHDKTDLLPQAVQSGMVVYHRGVTAPCFADYVPSADEVRSPWRIAMARDEYGPMQIGLYVPRKKRAFRDVRIQVGCDLPHRIGRIYYQLDRPLPYGFLIDSNTTACLGDVCMLL